MAKLASKHLKMEKLLELKKVMNTQEKLVQLKLY